MNVWRVRGWVGTMPVSAESGLKVKPRQREVNHLLGISGIPWRYVSPLRLAYDDRAEFPGRSPSARVLLIADKYKIHLVDEFRGALEARVAEARVEKKEEDDRLHYRCAEEVMEKRVGDVFASLRFGGVGFGVVQEPLYPGALEKKEVRVLQHEGRVIGEVAELCRDENDGTHYGLVLVEQDLYFQKGWKERVQGGLKVGDSGLTRALKAAWILPRPYDFDGRLE